MPSLQASSTSPPPQSNTQLQLKKLKQQNIQLHNQVFELQTEVNQVLSRQQHKKLKNLQLQNQLTSLYGEQLEDQQKKIKKLKEQVYYLKSSNAKLNLEYLNKQEDHLAILIQERDQLLIQKSLLKSNIKDKKNVLDKNSGLESHKKSLETQYTQTKKANTKTLVQIVQIQRELRKFHFVAESAKNLSTQNLTSQPIDISALQMQSQDTAYQISITQRQIKKIQDRWKPSVDALDTQFFSLSTEDKNKKAQLQKIIKQFKVIEHRSKSLRDEGEILQDRNRLSKIVTCTSSIGFSESLHKKNSIKESQPHLPETEFKARIKSDFILKEFEDLKVKSKRQKKDILQKSEDILLNQNKTFDLGMKKQSIAYHKEKAKIIPNRSLTQAELPLKQKVKPTVNASPPKQTQLKISEQPKAKIKRNQSLKSNNQKSQKSISISEPPTIQKTSKTKNQTKKPQIQALNQEKLSLKRANNEEKIYKVGEVKGKETKNHTQTKKQAKDKTQIKSTKESPAKDHKQIKTVQKSEITIQIPSNRNSLAKSPKTNLNQSQVKKTSNQNTVMKQKSKQNVNQKVQNQEKVARIVVTKSTDKINSPNVSEAKKNPKEKNQKLSNTQKTIQQSKSQQSKEAIQKDKKVLKELKESIEIKTKQNAIPQNSDKPSIKKIVKQPFKKVKQQAIQAQRFEIRLQNKGSTRQQSQKPKEQEKDLLKNSRKKIGLEPSMEPKSPKENKSHTKIKQSLGSQEVKQELVQQFKPYLIKRIRQGGALKFQNKEDESRQKADLLQLIEKQSIGVGIQ